MSGSEQFMVAVVEQPVLERSTLSRLRLWQQSVAQVRRTVEGHDRVGARMKVRLAVFRGLREPVFVLGSPRSGTTYLGELLSSLPDSTYFFEPQILKYYVRLVHENRVSPTQASWVYRLSLMSFLLAAPGHGPRPIEKNPNHVFAIDHLVSTFPDARFVAITRDGRDVAVSLAEKPWHQAASAGSVQREPGGYLFGPHPHFYIEEDRHDYFRRTSDVHRAIWIWRRHQEAIEDLTPRLGGDQLLRIRYEDLVLNPESTLAGLAGFLDVDEQGRRRLLARATTGRTSSVGRWQSALSASDLHEIEEEAGRLLRSLNYV